MAQQLIAKQAFTMNCILFLFMCIQRLTGAPCQLSLPLTAYMSLANALYLLHCLPRCLLCCLLCCLLHCLLHCLLYCLLQFRCFSSMELLLALNSLPGYLANLQVRVEEKDIAVCCLAAVHSYGCRLPHAVLLSRAHALQLQRLQVRAVVCVVPDCAAAPHCVCFSHLSCSAVHMLGPDINVCCLMFCKLYNIKQGRCRLLLVDNIAACIWHDRAAAVSSSGHSSYPTSAPPPYNPSFQGPAAAAAAAVPGLSAQRVQAAAAALLAELSQVWRFPVVVTKQAGVSIEERPEGPGLLQRELMSVPWQVRADCACSAVACHQQTKGVMVDMRPAPHW
jgi:hypothetical protein